MDISEQIIKALTDAENPMRPGEIAEAIGIDKDEVEKAIKKLKKDEKIYSPKRCFYDVKKEFSFSISVLQRN